VQPNRNSGENLLSTNVFGSHKLTQLH